MANASEMRLQTGLDQRFARRPVDLPTEEANPSQIAATIVHAVLGSAGSWSAAQYPLVVERFVAPSGGEA